MRNQNPDSTTARPVETPELFRSAPVTRNCRPVSKTGVTLVKYINTLRIEKARSLLLTKEPQKSIAEIADACGFYDVSYFTRVFREKTTSGKARQIFR